MSNDEKKKWKKKIKNNFEGLGERIESVLRMRLKERPKNDERMDKMEIEMLRHKTRAVSYTHLRAHETSLHLVCRLLL